jgi:hypothetical protein
MSLDGRISLNLRTILALRTILRLTLDRRTDLAVRTDPHLQTNLTSKKYITPRRAHPASPASPASPQNCNSSIISRRDTAGKKVQTVKTMPMLAENFGSRVIAEGIAERPDLRIVRDLGIGFVQAMRQHRLRRQLLRSQ